MSWAKSEVVGPFGDGDDVKALVVEALAGSKVTGNEHCLKERDEAVAAADEAAALIISSGKLGDPKSKSFMVAASGHANTDHEPDSDWANDFVSIQISQQ